MIFCGIVCILAFAGWTIKYAMDFAEKAEKKQKQQIEGIKKQIKELHKLIAEQKAKKEEEIEKLHKIINAIQVEKSLDQNFSDWATERKRIVQEIKRKYGGRIKFAAKKYNISQKVIIAVIAIESSGNDRAVSPVGAKGLMQLMPKTAKIMGIKDPFHTYENILAGVKYLKRLEKRFGNLDTALAAYNLGPTKVSELLKDHFNPSAYKYVRKVKAAMKEI